MRIAVFGKKPDTANYVRYLQDMGAEPLVTLDTEKLSDCHALLLPGGGDITPAFFGQENHGSRNIDTELDILQLQAFTLALDRHMPVLGICKGMQIINVGLGGTLVQDLDPDSATRHQYENGDKYHSTFIARDSWLYNLYGKTAMVNSAHHQALCRPGRDLDAVQHCPKDGCIEAIAHKTLPVIGVQWHPERIDASFSGTDGSKVLSYFLTLLRP